MVAMFALREAPPEPVEELIERRYTPPPLPLSALAHGKATPLTKVEADIACALDRARLSHRVGITPDSWQAELLRSDAQQIMLNCARQVGKSSTTATLASHTAIYSPGEPILLLSPTLRQSQLLFQRVKWVLKRLGSDFAELEKDNALSARLSNGSEIYSLPGTATTVRGFSGVRLAVVDEAAFIDDGLMTAISPMLAVSGGRLILLSSPYGKRGFFYREWTEGGDAWQRFIVKASECPRIPAAYLAEERRKLGTFYAQEFECEFLDTVSALFSGKDIDRAFDNDLAPAFDLGLLQEAT
jgi:hypothetical protein